MQVSVYDIWYVHTINIAPTSTPNMYLKIYVVGDDEGYDEGGGGGGSGGGGGGDDDDAAWWW